MHAEKETDWDPILIAGVKWAARSHNTSLSLRSGLSRICLSAHGSVFANWPLWLPEFYLYWRVSLLSLSPCCVTSRCPCLSLWLSPTPNRYNWFTIRTLPHRQAQPAPRLRLGLQGPPHLGLTTRVQTRGRPFYPQAQRQAKTSSTWNREWPVKFHSAHRKQTSRAMHKWRGSVGKYLCTLTHVQGFKVKQSVPVHVTNKTLNLKKCRFVCKHVYVIHHNNFPPDTLLQGMGELVSIDILQPDIPCELSSYKPFS